jgi:cell division transport system permease protein
MNSIALIRMLRNGLLNYRRNFWLSTAATIVMVITLFTITSLLLLQSLTALSLKSIQEKVDISIYFTLTTSEQTIKQIQAQVELLPEVKSVTYIPPVQAKDRFRELHKDEPLLLESLEQFDDDENPFPASFAIRVQSLSDYPKIIDLFQDEKFDPFVKKITDKRDIVDRLNKVTNGIRNTGLVLTAVFSAVTVIVMFNTVRLTIYSRRREIEIMRLVGASNWYIRGPFLIEGIFYGISGAILAAVLLFPLLFVMAPKLSSFLELQISVVNFVGINIIALFVFQMAFGTFLGIVSSLIAVRRYLNV